MRVEYELKFRDYALFNAIHQLFSIPTQAFYAGVAVLILRTVPADEGTLARVGVFCLTYVLMWVGQFVFTVVYLAPGRHRSLLTKHTVEIQDDGFYDETQYSRTCYYWPGIAKVVSRSALIAVYITSQSSFIIPKRALPSKAERISFIAELEARIKAAR